jgi:hypothetical protein
MKRINKIHAFLLAGLVAAVAAPLALAAGEGQPARGGARNPSADTRQAYTRETEFIANTSTYGTRLSNKSDNGGGAVYGCRSKAGGIAAGNEPCLRASNLADGYAFEFATSTGVLGGTITVGKGGDAARPFTTNATGVATGLNADRVDGKSAEDFLGATSKAADSAKLDGREASSFASAGDLLTARVNVAGNVTGGRGATSASFNAAEARYTVVFNRNVAGCTYAATQQGADAADDVTLSVSPGGADNAVTVDQAGTDAPVPFHLQVIC